MLWAVSYGTDSARDMRVLVVKHTLVATRFTAAVRSAKMVLAQGDDYIILWQDDTNSNSVPELS